MSYVVTNIPSASMYQAMKYTKIKDGLALKKHTVWRGRCIITHTCTHMIKILETNIEQWIS